MLSTSVLQLTLSSLPAGSRLLWPQKFSATIAK